LFNGCFPGFTELEKSHRKFEDLIKSLG